MTTSSRIIWQCCEFDELSSYDLYRILQLRAEVFVVEQNCVYQDVDELDLQALHVAGYLQAEDSKLSLTCYVRLLPPGVKYETASIGRVATKKSLRGGGLGKALMQQSIAYCHNEWPGTVITISAQQHLQKFYTELGFTAESEPYDEDGIPHIEMKLTP